VQDTANTGAGESGNAVCAVAPGLWALDSHFMTMGRKGSVRMSIVQTASGLLLYSPVALTGAHLEQIARLGRVAAIIAPNLYHHLYLRACSALYPEADVYVPEGLTEKIGPLDGASIIDAETVLDKNGDVDWFTFAGHMIRETVLYHRPSKTLITADLIYHFTRDQFPAERVFFWLMGCYGSPKIVFYHHFAIRSRPSIEDLIKKVSAWEVQRIVMCHGRIYEGADAGRLFTEAWRRF
ncbi:MAG: DUF4336 domain-containing protein, partial [Alphaproteobacteria bacterium]